MELYTIHDWHELHCGRISMFLSPQILCDKADSPYHMWSCVVLLKNKPGWLGYSKYWRPKLNRFRHSDSQQLGFLQFLAQTRNAPPSDSSQRTTTNSAYAGPVVNSIDDDANFVRSKKCRQLLHRPGHMKPDPLPTRRQFLCGRGMRTKGDSAGRPAWKTIRLHVLVLQLTRFQVWQRSKAVSFYSSTQLWIVVVVSLKWLLIFWHLFFFYPFPKDIWRSHNHFTVLWRPFSCEVIQEVICSLPTF